MNKEYLVKYSHSIDQNVLREMKNKRLQNKTLRKTLAAYRQKAPKNEQYGHYLCKV